MCSGLWLLARLRGPAEGPPRGFEDGKSGLIRATGGRSGGPEGEGPAGGSLNGRNSPWDASPSASRVSSFWDRALLGYHPASAPILAMAGAKHLKAQHQGGWPRARASSGSAADHLPGIVTTGISSRSTIPDSNFVIRRVGGADGGGGGLFPLNGNAGG
jgi:hypothetical protein